MESLQAKQLMMEATITDMAAKIDAYVQKMTGMMATVENIMLMSKGPLRPK